MHPASKKPREVEVAAPLDAIPLLLRGGSILPIRERVRRASTLMWRDPFTLLITADKKGEASGDLYLDDGDSYAYQSGAYIHRGYKLSSEGRHGYALRGSNLVGTAPDMNMSDITAYSPSDNTWAKSIAEVRIEKIVILGLDKEPASVKVGGQDIAFAWSSGAASSGSKEEEASQLIIKEPRILVARDWEITMQ